MVDDEDHHYDSLAMARSHMALSSAPSSASSDLALDFQPAAASTSSSASSSWAPSTLDLGPRSSRESETGSVRRRSSVEDDDDALGEYAEDGARSPGRARRGEDPAPAKRWRRMSKMAQASPPPSSVAGLEGGVESIDLSGDLDGDAASDLPHQDCDFGASQPAPPNSLATPAATFDSLPSTPDMRGGAATFSADLPAPPLEAADPAQPSFPLGKPVTRIFFCRDDQDDLVPPCFFPGQTIPTLVVLELPRYTCLPHDLAPALNISLIGTLRCPPSLVGDEPEDEWSQRILINVGVGLQDGMDLWQKDAQTAWERLSDKRKKGRSNPAVALPGGKYTLPLTVQVPSNPTLPPSFDLPTSAFEIGYHLSVTLSINDPEPAASPPGDHPRRVVLSRSKRDFALLPTTLPTLAPSLAPIPGLLEAPSRRDSFTALVGSASAGWLDRLSSAIDPLKAGFGVPTSRSAQLHDMSAASSSAADAWPTSWSIVPSMPTASFSPSSIVPVDFLLQPPTACPTALLPAGQLVIRAALLRREYVFASALAPLSTDAQEGLLSEEQIVSCVGRLDLAAAPGVRPSLPRLSLPLGVGAGTAWSKGFSTSLSVSPGPGSPHSHLQCASRFYLSLQLAFAPAGRLPPATNRFVLDDPFVVPSGLASRTVLIPILIGSVGEPPGANRRLWRELYLGQNDATGEERPQLVDGCAVDRDEAWILPPPSYEAALAEPVYTL